jgi:Sugar-transfer associated ATP-grasp
VLAKVSKILSLSQQRAQEGHLPFLRQLLEMAALRVLRGVGPRYYHTAGFWRRNLSWDDKAGQLSVREYRRVVDSLNPADYRKLSQNKIAEKAILSLFSLPTPRFLGRLAKDNGMDYLGRPLHRASELANLIRTENVDKLVFKEIEGWGGKGVRIAKLRLSRDIFCAPINREDYEPLAEFCESVLGLSRGGDWLVEEYFKQHSVMAQLNPTSVNTLRIWILERSATESVVVTAHARIGRGNMIVDNVTSGGIVAPIDLPTGVLQAGQDADVDRQLYPRHPDHGAPIQGIAVPYWNHVQSMGKRVLGVFPHLHFAGLDVAIGEAGPAVLAA